MHLAFVSVAVVICHFLFPFFVSFFLLFSRLFSAFSFTVVSPVELGLILIHVLVEQIEHNHYHGKH